MWYYLTHRRRRIRELVWMWIQVELGLIKMSQSSEWATTPWKILPQLCYRNVVLTTVRRMWLVPEVTSFSALFAIVYTYKFLTIYSVVGKWWVAKKKKKKKKLNEKQKNKIRTRRMIIDNISSKMKGDF